MSFAKSSLITRREALCLLPFAGTSILFPNCGGKRSRHTNILFVMSDDHTHHQLGCAGNPLIKTPAMDRLAHEGIRFKNAFVTNSLCAPSRATLLTGCYSNIHKILGNSEARSQKEQMNLSLPTFPQLLRDMGYFTGLVGKWHLPHHPSGFDYYCVLPGQGVYFNPEFIENGTRRQFEGYVTDVTTNLALNFLKSVSEPFCLLYHQKGPHRPFKPAPRHRELYQDIDIAYPETFYDDYATRCIAAKAKDMRIEVSLAGDYQDINPSLTVSEKKEWIYQRFVKNHYRAVQAIDEGLGKVLDYLDYRGFSNNTVVIYTSDNGFFLGEHGWYDKRFMYEPSIRIPLLLRYPDGVEANKVEEGMVLNVDIAPTILDFAGISIPKSMQGKSLRSLLERKKGGWRDSIYYSYYENSWALRNASREELIDPAFEYFTAHRIGPHRGIRTSRYKLIEYYSKDNYWEFFDLENDPHELTNVYSDSAYSGLVDDLTRELKRSQQKYGDTRIWEQLICPDYGC
jgi:arylsulfatase A-like enzyme